MKARSSLDVAWRPLHNAGLSVWRGLTRPPRPLLGIEIDSATVGVVKLRRGRGDAVAVEALVEQPIAPGVVVPSLTAPGVVDAAALKLALRQALERAGALGEKRASLVLPDVVARVAVLKAEELPKTRGAPPDDVLRFRLRDRVPFDIREARLSSAPVNGRAGQDVSEWVVAVGLGAILDGYEAPCAALGLEVGRVEISGLALLRGGLSAHRSGDWLLVQWGREYASLFLWREGRLVLARTLSGKAEPQDVAREVASTVLYHRERLGGILSGSLLRVAGRSSQEARAYLEGPLGIRPEILDPLGGAREDGGELASPPAVAAVASLVSEEV